VELSAIIQRGAREHPDQPAVRCEGATQTYADLYERSCKLANALEALGIEPGERVATLGDNCLQSIEQMSGLALGGFVRSSLYTHNAPESNLYLLDLVEASALLIQRKHYEAIAPRLGEVAALRQVLVFDGDASDEARDYERALATAASSDPELALAPDDDHIIRFSAGTTGKPKGILHTVSGWTSVGSEMTLAMPPQNASDSYLAAGPLAHAAGLPVWATLGAGGTIIVMSAFDPGRFLSLIAEQRCTTAFLVPTMIQMVVNHPSAPDADLSSLRAVIYGAAPISERTLEQAHSVWGKIMYQMYGQSEAVPLTVLPPEDHVVDGSPEERRRLRSAGRPTPNTKIRILDPDGTDLPPGQIGEVAASSPAAMAAIWRDPQATSERILADGFVLTRDMGYLDEDGYLFLADRKEDMIISGGFNIWPAELENALASHPAVAEVAVVGIAHEKWGETPKAVVVLCDGQQADERELIDWTRAKLGAVKRVTSVDFVDELPKTPLGKVLRRQVRDRYREGSEQALAGA
jgi:acyl-CoA synthetase (AMP-forming)/AMP-acid ligase II